jgi:hypothetical protein
MIDGWRFWEGILFRDKNTLGWNFSIHLFEIRCGFELQFLPLRNFSVHLHLWLVSVGLYWLSMKGNVG